jgi:hypothetical protein
MFPPTLAIRLDYLVGLESTRRAPIVILLALLTLLALCFAACPAEGTRLLLKLLTGECFKKASPVNSKDYNKLLDTEYQSYGKMTPVRNSAKRMGGHGSRDTPSGAGVRATPGSGMLIVRLSHAVGLKSMDRNGFSDPYVKLVLGKKKVTSKTIYKTLNPRWDEDFMFAGSLAQLRNEVLHVHGWDYDGAFSKSDKLGDGSVDLSQVAGLEEGGAIEVAVELDDGQETPGVVHLVVSLEKPAECGAASGMPASAASATGSSGLAAMV